MTAQKPSDAGFSLLETLLGLTLTALIAVLMTGSLQMGARVWERSSDANLPGSRQLIESRISDWIAQASPPSDQPPTDGEPVFSGDGSQVSFIVAGQNLGGPPGIYRIRLALIPTEGCSDGRALVVSTRLLSPGGQNSAILETPFAARELLPCIADPAFAFYGYSGAGDALVEAWRPEWTEFNSLPMIVALRSLQQGEAGTAVIAQRIAHATRVPNDVE